VVCGLYFTFDGGFLAEEGLLGLLDLLQLVGHPAALPHRGQLELVAPAAQEVGSEENVPSLCEQSGRRLGHIYYYLLLINYYYLCVGWPCAPELLEVLDDEGQLLLEVDQLIGAVLVALLAGSHLLTDASQGQGLFTQKKVVEKNGNVK
jgi:hypothetical protein